MNLKRKKPRTQSSYVRQVLAIIDRYISETGEKNPEYHNVAAWAHRLGLIEPPHHDIVKQIARDMARASRQDYIADENGEPVRRRHAFREDRGDKQLTFWFKMEDATPEKMRLSAQRRRNGTLMDVLQLDRDIRYYNKNYNPGDPILFDANFNPDVEERHLPTDWSDAPPDETTGPSVSQPPL